MAVAEANNSENMNQSKTQTKAQPVSGTHMPAFVFQTGKDLAKHAAQTVARLIRERSDVGQTTVLGLPTGSTPAGTYRELIRLHQDEGLDFSQVIVFCLGEFYGIPPEEPQSHRKWLAAHFCDAVNLKSENIHCLDGQVSQDDVEMHCRRYDETDQSSYRIRPAATAWRRRRSVIRPGGSG